jgi:hypothetical protein
MKHKQRIECDWEGCSNLANIDDLWGDFIFCNYHNNLLYAGLKELEHQEQSTKKTKKMLDEEAPSKETQV